MNKQDCGEIIEIKLPKASPEELIYLASPFSHEDQKVEQMRFKQACRCAAILTEAGYNVFSPIAHTYSIARFGRIDGGWNTWEKFDTLMLTACDQLFVYCLPGYKESAGVCSEVNLAHALSKPVVLLHTWEVKNIKMRGEMEDVSQKACLP